MMPHILAADLFSPLVGLLPIFEQAAEHASEHATEHAHSKSSLGTNMAFLCGAILLVILNGFFVAAEFAMVKIRPSQINKLVQEKRPFAKAAKWLLAARQQPRRLPTGNHHGVVGIGLRW